MTPKDFRAYQRAARNKSVCCPECFSPCNILELDGREPRAMASTDGPVFPPGLNVLCSGCDYASTLEMHIARQAQRRQSFRSGVA